MNYTTHLSFVLDRKEQTCIFIEKENPDKNILYKINYYISIFDIFLIGFVLVCTRQTLLLYNVNKDFFYYTCIFIFSYFTWISRRKVTRVGLVKENFLSRPLSWKLTKNTFLVSGTYKELVKIELKILIVSHLTEILYTQIFKLYTYVSFLIMVLVLGFLNVDSPLYCI